MSRQNVEIFKRVLVSKSLNKDFEVALDEWQVLNCFPIEVETKCICSQKIKNGHYCTNTDTQETIVVGVCCQKKFIPKWNEELKARRDKAKQVQKQEVEEFFNSQQKEKMLNLVGGDSKFVSEYWYEYQRKALPTERVDDRFVTLIESFCTDRIVLYDLLVNGASEEVLKGNRLYKSLWNVLPQGKHTKEEKITFWLKKGYIEKVS